MQKEQIEMILAAEQSANLFHQTQVLARATPRIELRLHRAEIVHGLKHHAGLRVQRIAASGAAPVGTAAS